MNTAEIIQIDRQDNNTMQAEELCLAGLPVPMTPSYCDLTDYHYMPLDVSQFLGSAFLAEVDPEAGFYAMQLWAKSWHEVPAGSLPNNDKVLAKAVGLRRDMKAFAELKEDMLYGWELCSDGRFYHPVIAEKALESFVPKLLHRIKSGIAIAKRWGNEFDGRELSLQLGFAFELLKKTSPSSKTTINGIPKEYQPQSMGIDQEYLQNTTGIPQEYQVKVSRSISEYTPPNPPKGGLPKIKPENREIIKKAFAHFWENMKTQKAGKKPAEKAFLKITKAMSDDEIREFSKKILKDQHDRMEIIGDSEHSFLNMHPSTYLNQERWTDAMPVIRGGSANDGGLKVPPFDYDGATELQNWALSNGLRGADQGESARDYHTALIRLAKERNNG